MKNFILILTLFFLAGNVNAQNWQSIPKAQSFGVPPVKFIINPYNNQMWFIGGTSVHMLDTNGQNRLFQSELQGNLYAGNDMSFTFTPDHIYFSDNGNGLYTFDNYVKNLVYPHVSIRSISSNKDTIYLTNSTQNQGFYKYHTGNIYTTSLYVEGIVAKNNFIYADLSVPAQVTGSNPNSFVFLHTDPQYAGGSKHEMKFSRRSDTLFVCGKKGISYAYNYDFLDTIAPSNSINMPARNVLEIEFNHLYRLWAVFGDASNKAFALARFDNGTWVEKYDASNCPINFATYRGFEIDTLGNIWVVDDFNLHTLLTPNSPIWLSTVELKKDVSMNVYPNPSSGTVNISSNENMESIAIYDCMGRLVYSEKMNAAKTQDVNISFLENGNYVLEASSGDVISRSQLVLVK
jgi:hypothetical protein